MEAEGVRLRGYATRIVTRVVFGLIAATFVVGALVFAHVAAWYWLRTALEQTVIATAGILGGADLLVAIVLGGLATRSAPSRVEVQALEVRRKAVEAMSSGMSLTRLAIPILTAVAGAWRGRGQHRP